MTEVIDLEDSLVLSPKQLVPSSKLVRNLKAYLDIIKSKKRPIFITRDNEIDAVLLNINDYRSMYEETKQTEEAYTHLQKAYELLSGVIKGENNGDGEYARESLDKSFQFLKEALNKIKR